MQIEIERLLLNGAGEAQHDGLIVQVKGAIPGDIVKVTAISTKKRRVRASLDKIIRPSSDRVTPTCPFHETCGGCDLAHMNDSARRAAIATAVGRGIRYTDKVEVTPSPSQTGHRARIKMTVKRGVVGYLSSGTNDLVEIPHCQIARPEVNEVLAELRLALAGSDCISSVEIRSNGSEVHVNATAIEQQHAQAASQLSALKNVAINGRHAHGNTRFCIDIEGQTLQIGPRSFYQVNLEVNKLLIQHILRVTARLKPGRLLDLYAGIGNIGLPIAAQGVPVVAVERDKEAIRNSVATANEAGYSFTGICKSVERFDTTTEPFDVVILDPPRSGAPGVLNRIMLTRPRAIIYVSCDLFTAARDINCVLAAGYSITSVDCFEMFPQTHHIETVLVIERPTS